MSQTVDQLLATAKGAALDEVKIVLATSKTGFLTAFRDFLVPADLIELDGAFDLALRAKLGQLGALSPNEADDFADQYEASLNAIETIGDRYEIVGKAKAGVLLRSFAHQVISGFAAVAGAVFQGAMTVFLGPIGTIVGGGANAGLQHVVSYFLGD